MPELPEVETVRRGLEPAFLGIEIAEVELRRPDLRFPLPPRFAERLAGAAVSDLSRRGKYLIGRLSTGEALIMHLGMSGRFTIHPPAGGAETLAVPAFYHAASPGTHDHVLFRMGNGGTVVYSDHRRFGFMDLAAADRLEENRFLKTLGPEPLGNAFSGPMLAERLAGRRTSLKAALLDQRVVAGLGNIYVCEALYRAGLSPRRLALNTIGRERTERLANAIRSVLLAAIEAGGSTLRDYAHTDGSLGYFQHAFDVYDRESEACRKPGCGGTVQRIVQSGRSTFFCPRCQR